MMRLPSSPALRMPPSMSLSTSARCICSCSCGRASSSERSLTIIFCLPVSGSRSSRMVISGIAGLLNFFPRSGFLRFFLLAAHGRLTLGPVFLGRRLVAGELQDCLGVDGFLFQEHVAQRLQQSAVFTQDASGTLPSFFQQSTDGAVEGVFLTLGQISATLALVLVGHE